MGESRSLVSVLLAWRRFVVRVTVAAAVIAVVVSLLLPSWYGAVATMLPPQQASSAGGLGELVATLGAGFQPGTGARAAQRLLSRSPVTDLALGVLKSERLRGQVVDRFDLVAAYDVPDRQHAIRQLGDHVEASTTPEGMVQVRVEDRDRQRAADMANAFVEFLDRFNREVSVESARRTLEFIDRSLVDTRVRLDAASDSLRRFQETHGAVQLTDQARVTVDALAALAAERTKLEIQRGVLERYATRSRAEMDRIDAEVRAIDDQLAALVRTREPRAGSVPSPDGPAGSRSGGAHRPGDVMLPLGDLPRLALEFAELKREVLVQENVYEFLTAQHEEARIRETQDQETVTILDAATPPLKKARPRRSLIVVVSTLAAFGFALGFVLAAQRMLEFLEEPAGAELRAPLDPVRRALVSLRSWGSSPAGLDGG